MTTEMTVTKTKRQAKAIKPVVSKILGLRTCNADMSSYNGFIWPETGRVECPDWNPKPVCGGGLHFLPWGEGNAELLDWGTDAKWLVIEVEADKAVAIDSEKSKAPYCDVLYCGDRLGATSYIVNNGGQGRAVHGGTATAGDKGTATAGDEGTATAGDKGTATAGNYGTATAGNYGTATAGDNGTATAGNYGTATAGDKGTATAGDNGTATAGDEGTATAGNYGTATAGDEGTIMIKRWNGKRYKFSIGYVGEDGILPDTAYELDIDGKFVLAN